MTRHHHRITHAAAMTLALTALGAPPVLAMPVPAGPGPCSEVCSGGGYASDVSSTNGYQSARVPATAVRIIPATSGFDWGDAGIGAGAAVGLMLAGTGGTLLLAHRRTQSRTAS